MIIINDKYTIKSDKDQWMLCKPCKATKSNPTGWKAFKFYASQGDLAASLAQILLRTSDYDSFAQLSTNAKNISEMLDYKLKDIRVTYK